MSRPIRIRSPTSSRWLTRVTSWSMIGPGVELLGDVVGGGADQLDAALVGAAVGVGADEGRQEAVVDVDRRRAEPPQELGARGPACSGRGRAGRLPPSSSSARRSAAVAGAGVDRHVVEGEAERFDLFGVIGVVGDDRDHLGAELAAAPAPEQVGEAVVFARDHDRDPLALARLGEAVVHLEAAPRPPPRSAAAELLALALGDRRRRPSA